MSLNVPPEDYECIRDLIRNDDSPVGIDATRTHVVIIRLLEEIRERLEALEAQLADPGEG